MRKTITGWPTALLLILIAASPASPLATQGRARAVPAGDSSPCNSGQSSSFKLESTIAFASTRDNPTGMPAADAAEIYLMNPDGTNQRRLTDNTTGDGFANLSPDGKKIVFDSDRLSGHTNVSDLFLMNADGSDQTYLTRGSSATWSPDCKQIAFHASASGDGTPIRQDPGSATTDSDIFIANVDDMLSGQAQPTDITNSDGVIDDDPDWSPDGEHIVYTAHPAADNPVQSNRAELYLINADGGGSPTRLTSNNEEERAPAWSPDSSRIVYSCRIGAEATPAADFEICVMNADGTGVQQLTDNAVPDLTPTFSPDGQQIVFQHQASGQGFQLFTMNSSLNPDGSLPTATKLTAPPGINLIAHWGQLRVHQNP
jgi:TolB protein